jgi:nucleoside 2-deoxyribosyltransferase
VRRGAGAEVRAGEEEGVAWSIVVLQQILDGYRYCWVCGGEFAEPWPHGGEWIRVDCNACGKYDITQTLYFSQFPPGDSERYRVSFHLLQRTLNGGEPPGLTSDLFPQFYAQIPPAPPTHEKVGILLLSLARLNQTAGGRIVFDSYRQYSLACARDMGEVEFFIQGLKDAGYIKSIDPIKAKSFMITHAGWAEAARLAAVSVIASKRCFAALRFNKEMLAVYDLAIAPAIAAAGYEPRIANRPTHNDQIDAHIVAEIKGSRFLVADVTYGAAGVYFEAGYAIGLGRPVIWMCRRDRKPEDVHFDTQQYNHILWDSPEHLRAELTDRIVATI